MTWIEKDGVVLAWAINDEYEDYTDYYTRARYRGRGLATRLAQRLARDGRLGEVCAHSDESDALYDTVERLRTKIKPKRKSKRR